ncbi:hypothetical protein [Arthrobacter sp. 92]|uniref:hypothetical protein n=1 Tax=Arthrobacter sp. 92 TaxID=3418175 RepID=UPI003D0325DD
MAEPGAGIRPDARRLRRWAWVSVAAVPLAFAAAMFLGDGLLSMQGYSSGGENPVPLGAALLAGVPAVLLMAFPAVAAIVLGLRARKRGAAYGIVPAAIGLTVVAFALLTNALPVLLGLR